MSQLFTFPGASRVAQSFIVHLLFLGSYAQAWRLAQYGSKLSVLEEQCLNRRIAGMATMQTEVSARQERDRNTHTRTIDRQFTMTDAKIKVKPFIRN